jgi:hypothetical protein
MKIIHYNNLINKKMDGKTTFTQFRVDNLNQPLLYKLNKLKRNLNKNFKYYDIRKIDVDYDKHKNFFKYMKELAYLKYRKNHLVKIFKKYYFNKFTQKDFNNLKRNKSHNNPYHIKTYQRLIYRNLYNYQYKPYVLPLNKEDKINKLNLTDTILKKKKTKKKIFSNPYLDRKIKYLTKVNQRLLNKNLKNEENKNKNIESFKLIKSNSVSLLYNNKFNLNKNYLMDFKKLEILPNIKNYKINYSSIDNNKSYNDENRTIMKSLNVNKSRILLLPKIQNDCLSTINTSKKLEKDLKIFKYGKKETPKKEEENIDENNLLNLSPRKIFKLFFGRNKTKPKKVFKIKKSKINNSSSKNINKGKNIISLNLKNDKNPSFYNDNKDMKIGKDNINDISIINGRNNSNDLNEESSNDKNIFSFDPID